jgi:hypothetical protein
MTGPDLPAVLKFRREGLCVHVRFLTDLRAVIRDLIGQQSGNES